MLIARELTTFCVTWRVPPPNVILPDDAPRLASDEMESVPAFSVTPPEKELVPLSERVPAPDIVIPRLPPASAMLPLTVRFDLFDKFHVPVYAAAPVGSPSVIPAEIVRAPTLPVAE